MPAALGLILGFLCWPLIELIIDPKETKASKLIIALIGIFGTLITGIITAIIKHSQTRHREMAVQEKISQRELEVQQKIREREIEESHRQRKVEIYNDFLKLISSYFQGNNENNKKKMPSQQKVMDELEKFQNGVLLWGGPKVVQSYLEYRRNADGNNTAEMFKAIDVLYKSLREDIGLSNEGLDNYETIQLYLRDPKEINILIEDITK